MRLNPTVFNLSDAAATLNLGRRLGAILPAGIILLLQGNLGSGKTTLVKGLGMGLEIAETIDSPTFTLINEYLDGRVPLYHVDLYRIDPDQVNGLFLDAYWDSSEVEPGITAIEWAERLPWLPPNFLEITLAHQEAGRQATLTPSTEDQAQLLEALTTCGIG